MIGPGSVDILKSADESRTSTTVAIDGDLVKTVVAGGVYEFWISTSVTTATTGQIKYDWGGTATATTFMAWAWTISSTHLSVTITQTWDLKTSLGGAGSVMACFPDAANEFFAKGTIVVNAGGTFGLTWASDTGPSVTVNRDAYMMIRRIS